MFTPIVPSGSAKPIAPYVAGTRAGNTIYVSGTLPLTGDGKVAHPGVLRRRPGTVLDQIKVVLEGWRRDDGRHRVQYDLHFDVRHYQEMNKVYRNTSRIAPARYCIVSASLCATFCRRDRFDCVCRLNGIIIMKLAVLQPHPL